MLWIMNERTVEGNPLRGSYEKRYFLNAKLCLWEAFRLSFVFTAPSLEQRKRVMGQAQE